MYGNRATRRQKQKKMKESEVLGKSKDCTLPNNWFKYQIYKKIYSWIHFPVFIRIRVIKQN